MSLEPFVADEVSPSPGWKAILGVLAMYAAAISAATYPYVLTMDSGLPSQGDPAQHLTVLRWYRTCLLEGRSPLVLSELQYPAGAPLGNFSPLHLEALLYLPLSLLIPNDVLCYNLLWLGGLLLTGVGTFVLAWQVLRDRVCAAFAGLTAMLGGTVLLHARGHLELMYVGMFPLFLAAWLRFVERPDRRRLLVAAGLYVMLSMAAAYFAVFAVFPAALALVWGAAKAGRQEIRPWLRGRIAWSAAFVGLVLPVLMLLFSSQLWAVAQGFSASRPRTEFDRYGAPIWGYVLPTALHPIHTLLGLNFNGFDDLGYPAIECAAYLGVVSLGLILFAAIGRTRFPGRGYWWACFVLLVVLSFGASLRFGSFQIKMPTSWLWRHFFAFRLIRVPARFSLFATICAAVIAAAGLRHLRSRFARPWARTLLPFVLAMVAIADLAMVPFSGEVLPPPPSAYAELMRRDPEATLIDAPQFGSGEYHKLNALPGYWQLSHRGKTTAGYSGQANPLFDMRYVLTSPFYTFNMIAADYLEDPTSTQFGLVSEANARDYTWLYMQANDLRYVVLHDWEGAIPEFPVQIDRLKALLAGTELFERGEITVYDRDLLPFPKEPVILPLDGWRVRALGRPGQVVGRRASVAVCSPSPDVEMTLTLSASAFRRPRSVRVLGPEGELARWEIRPGDLQSFISPPFRLPAGLHELVIASDGQEKPRKRREFATETDSRSYSLIVTGLHLDSIAPRLATRPR